LAHELAPEFPEISDLSSPLCRYTTFKRHHPDTFGRRPLYGPYGDLPKFKSCYAAAAVTSFFCYLVKRKAIRGGLG